MRIGIVGAGGMGNVHARHHRNISGVEPAVCDVDAERRKALADRWQIAEKDSFEEVLSWADAIDLCVPTPLHLELGLKVIAAGKALLVEKPIAGSVEDGAKLVSAAQKAGVPLMPGHVVRFFPEFRRAHEVVESGTIGNPAAARTRRGGGMPKGAGLWFSDHSKSGGVLLDLAIHDFDWLRWTLGEVKSVFSKSRGAIRGDGPDYALTTLQFDSGTIAHVEATWMDPSGFRVTLEVCGSEGMIEYDSRFTPSLRTSLDGSPTVNEAPLDPTDDPYYNQLKGFVDAVRENREPPVTGFDGLMAVSIASAAIESAKTGKAIAPARLM
jgi:predicted dehydrogenase